MKQLIYTFVFLLLLLFVSSFGYAIILENTYFGDLSRGSSWEESKCEICGKTIYEEVTDTYSYSGEVLYMDGSGWTIPRGERASYISIELKIRVCRECDKLYEKEIQELVKAVWEKVILEKQLENTENIQKHDEERILKKITELETTIIKLQRKLNLLKDVVE